MVQSSWKKQWQWKFIQLVPLNIVVEKTQRGIICALKCKKIVSQRFPTLCNSMLCIHDTLWDDCSWRCMLRFLKRHIICITPLDLQDTSVGSLLISFIIKQQWVMLSYRDLCTHILWKLRNDCKYIMWSEEKEKE